MAHFTTSNCLPSNNMLCLDESNAEAKVFPSVCVSVPSNPHFTRCSCFIMQSSSCSLMLALSHTTSVSFALNLHKWREDGRATNNTNTVQSRAEQWVRQTYSAQRTIANALNLHTSPANSTATHGHYTHTAAIWSQT